MIVANKGKYAITDLDVMLSPDGRTVIPFSKRQNIGLGLALDRVPAWAMAAKGTIGDAYVGAIAPGAAMRFESYEHPGSVLKTAYPVVRWLDHWGDCWEYCKGNVYPSDIQADWNASLGRA